MLVPHSFSRPVRSTFRRQSATTHESESLSLTCPPPGRPDAQFSRVSSYVSVCAPTWPNRARVAITLHCVLELRIIVGNLNWCAVTSTSACIRHDYAERAVPSAKQLSKGFPDLEQPSEECRPSRTARRCCPLLCA